MAANGCVLIGYRACGKTSFGQGLAERCGWRFRDSDQEIEAAQGYGIAAAFELDGVAAFRQREAAVIARLLTEPGQVLATGGGCIETVAMRESLRRGPHPVIYLQAPAAVLQARLRADSGGRPSLTGDDPAAEVPAVLARRENWYRQCADIVVSSDQPPPAVYAALLVAVENWSTRVEN